MTTEEHLAAVERRIAAAKAILAHEVASEDRDLALFLIGEALDGRNIDDEEASDNSETDPGMLPRLPRAGGRYQVTFRKEGDEHVDGIVEPDRARTPMSTRTDAICGPLRPPTELEDTIRFLRQAIEQHMIARGALGNDVARMRQRAERAEAEAAAMREALLDVVDEDTPKVLYTSVLKKAQGALSGTAGQALLDSLAKLKAAGHTARDCDGALADWINARAAEAMNDHSAESMTRTFMAYKRLLDAAIPMRDALAALDALDGTGRGGSERN